MGCNGWHGILEYGALQASFLSVAAACQPRTSRSHRLDARFLFVVCLRRKRGFFFPALLVRLLFLCVS